VFVIASCIGATLVLVVVLLFGWASPNSRSSAPKTPAFGLVQGVASPCIGVAMPSSHFPPVSVEVLRGETVIANFETVRPNYKFELKLSPGSYVIKGAAQVTDSVTVVAGKKTTVSLNPGCE
jgi:hypothetical protein